MRNQPSSAMQHLSGTPELRHGGNLAAAKSEFGGTDEEWIDLSTGISPWAYPAPSIAASQWRLLPPEPTSLVAAAANYYDCQAEMITVTPGSQLPIRLIPMLLDNSQSVAVPSVGYQEHARSWQSAGHQLVYYGNVDELETLVIDKRVESAVVINPNNPTGEIAEKALLRLIASRLPGLLVIDEAFADLDDSVSLCNGPLLDNTIIMRSLGKFFGLAGARVGFTIGSNTITQRLKNVLAPWSINAPAQYVAELALRDRRWQQQQRLKIRQQAEELNGLLSGFVSGELSTSNILLTPSSHKQGFSLYTHGLFSTITGNHDSIVTLHRKLAIARIWTRVGDTYQDQSTSDQLPSKKNWLRFSLPGKHMASLCNVLSAIDLK